MTHKISKLGFKAKIKSLFEGIKLSYCLAAIFGSALMSFGLYNIHSISGVTEGGVLGLVLLLEHWFDISPSVSSFVLNTACYIFGWKTLGRKFVIYSIVATSGFSCSYAIFERFDPIYPQIADMPLAAAVIGALFIGISAGICVRVGGAPSGDDALAMSLSKLTHVHIQWVYLFSDLSVLLLSLSYIPFRRIAYSLLTVILSGQIIGLVQKIKLPKLERKLEERKDII
ncbi:MAG: YitT family protein [Candidatus Limivicinus sp.]|jgi:uncharacterized membrane-anchored protein YitT (DUF2179 family)